jgi:hypothetical protein
VIEDASQYHAFDKLPKQFNPPNGFYGLYKSNRKPVGKKVPNSVALDLTFMLEKQRINCKTGYLKNR